MQECPRCTQQVRDGIRFCPACGAGLTSWTGRLRSGDMLIDRYTIVRPLARGGMGAVYLATDGRLGDAPVALKEMTPRHAPGDTEAWDRAVSEFRREAALLARLSHPNLPHVIDQFARDEHEFLVMELVAGHTLRSEQEQRSEPVPLPEALDWFSQLAMVLEYLHSQQPPIIYRDLKPLNIMLRPDGRIVLIDFGIARLYKPEQTSDTSIYGTPGYSPPEQYGLGQTDARTDVYALAMVFHELLTRFEPSKRLATRPPLAHTLRSEVPPHISQAINRALAPDPDDRFPTVAAFRQAALDAPAAVTNPPTSRLAQVTRWRGWLVLLALVVLLAVGSGVWQLLQPGPAPSVATITPLIAGATAEIAPTSVTSPTSTPLPNLPPAPDGMVAVGGGTFTIGSDSGQPDEEPGGRGFLPLFFIDRTEVTVAAYRQCVDNGACTPPVNSSSQTRPDYFTSPDYASYPVIWVTWAQAQTYCGTLNRRLPTEAEWEKAARGPDGFTYPWGNTWSAQNAHIWGSSAGGDTAPAGSLPAGASPYGALDMTGNVLEWTSSLDTPYPYSQGDGRELLNDPGARIVRGAWGPQPADARAADRDRRMPDNASFNLGFRCATSQPFAPPGMDFIPGGTWTMGATDAQFELWATEFGWNVFPNEQPAEPITTAGFYLDHTEVTNAQYFAFVQATGHAVPRNAFDPDGLAIWAADGTVPVSLTEHPVVNVNWGAARDFCAWADKRLPTEAEWERAARGDDDRAWPWGQDWISNHTNTSEAGLGTTTSVGSYPAGAGPYGTQDMAGNVWEWTSSLNRPYPYTDADLRESPNASGSRIMRGGSWLDARVAAHTTGRNALDPTLANTNVGFRCAQSIDQ